MKVHFLGTCAGTEPFPDRKHACVALEVNGDIYWIDAGDGCARTGHLLGLDLTKIRKIIISHTHMDHVGGLPNLLWYIRKIADVRGIVPDDIDMYIPNEEVADGIYMILRNTEGGYYHEFDINQYGVFDGELFDDGSVRVTAFHNYHLHGRPEAGCRTKFNQEKIWNSFTFRIECEGKSIVYSGDFKKLSELDEAIGDGCDLIVIETGHHGVDGVYEYLKDKKIGKICFSHNGREILNNYEASVEKVNEYFGERGVICEDGMSIEM